MRQLVQTDLFEVRADIAASEEIPDNVKRPRLGVLSFRLHEFDPDEFVEHRGEAPRVCQNLVFLLAPTTAPPRGETSGRAAGPAGHPHPAPTDRRGTQGHRPGAAQRAPGGLERQPRASPAQRVQGAGTREPQRAAHRRGGDLSPAPLPRPRRGPSGPAGPGQGRRRAVGRRLRRPAAGVQHHPPARRRRRAHHQRARQRHRGAPLPEPIVLRLQPAGRRGPAGARLRATAPAGPFSRPRTCCGISCAKAPAGTSGASHTCPIATPTSPMPSTTATPHRGSTSSRRARNG
ncbi:MAG: hypothetical protein U5L11_10670 [Arhodomonas sp.]|nr:hypothetical protein [Arhodomonas sp.]